MILTATVMRARRRSRLTGLDPRSSASDEAAAAAARDRRRAEARRTLLHSLHRCETLRSAALNPQRTRRSTDTPGLAAQLVAYLRAVASSGARSSTGITKGGW